MTTECLNEVHEASTDGLRATILAAVVAVLIVIPVALSAISLF
jgi:hypothetical protein